MKIETIVLTIAVLVITLLVWQSAMQEAQTREHTDRLATQQEIIIDLNERIVELQRKNR